MKKNYEIILMFGLDFEDQISSMIERYQSMVKNSVGGVVHRFEDWGRMNLAYVIDKQKKAHYFLMNIECDNKIVVELEKLFKFNDAVIRHLILRKDEPVSEKSSMMKNVVERPDYSSRN